MRTLEPDASVDSDHPDIVAFAARHRADTPRQTAIRLFLAVRDGLRYNPYRVSLRREDYVASRILARDPQLGGHCIDKALILAAAARASGIPARLHFANVRNHLGTAKLEEKLGTDLLVFHGYAELELDGRWVAATPAFNRELCERLGVAPLEFDGVNDAIFQEYGPNGRFMEYVHDHGSFDTLPFDEMIAEWRRHYARMPDTWGD